MRGQIITPASTNVLDPNGDGFVSKTSGGFSNDGYYVDEFEIHMFGLPIYEDGEVLNDIQAGPACGITDLSVDTAGYTVYTTIDDNNNLIFRFRVADDNPSVEGYSILIDTDGKIGSDDPNSTPDNPGFEIDITMIKSQTKGIFVYNIDGIESCPTPDLIYGFSSNFQKSVAGIASCGNPDYFYDFYVPFDDLQAKYGITKNTEIRMVALTNISATCAMAGSISDVGGVNDNDFTGCAVCAFDSLISVQCSTVFGDLCTSCGGGGFKFGSTPKPHINVPIKAEQKVVTGTAVPGSTVFLDVFNSSKLLVDQDTVTADSFGGWASFMDSILYFADSITVRAQISGMCRSGLSESDLAYAIVVFNHIPVLTGASDTLVYHENDPAVSIEPAVYINDIDDSLLVSARIQINSNYHLPEDSLIFSNQHGITGIYNAASGMLTLYGFSSIANYQAALAGIKYINQSENPVNDVRKILFMVKDTVDWSDPIIRSVKVIPVNDPSTITGKSTALLYNNGDGTVIIDNSISISDPDNTMISGAKIRISQNDNPSEDLISFTDQSGITGSYNASAALLTLSGTASLANYATALGSITYTNSNNPPLSALTRRVSFTVFDGLDSSNVFIRAIDMASTNSPPEIVDSGNNSIDTIYTSTNEDIPVEVCLKVIDPDGDFVYVSSAVSLTGNGTIVGDSLCSVYTPNQNYNGTDTVKIIVCDDASPSYCDSVLVIIDVQPVDDPPQILVNGQPLDTLYLTTLEDTPVDYCLQVSDAENDAVAISSLNALDDLGTYIYGTPDNLCFTFTPLPDSNGIAYGEIRVCETKPGGLCDSLPIVIEIAPVNDPPHIFDQSDTIRIQMSENTTQKICIDASDPENDNISLTETGSYTNNGSYDLGASSDLCFNFTPNPFFTGTEIGQVKVCDNGIPSMCDSAVIVIEVLPVNYPPVFNNDSVAVDTIYLSTDEDIPLDFCTNITDPNGDTVLISDISSIEANGTLERNPGSDFCFVYTPLQNFFGQSSWKITACDNGQPGLCDTLIVIIDINSINDPPDILGDTISMQTLENTTTDICITATDPENDSLTLTQVRSITNHGTYDLGAAANFCFSFTPTKDFVGIEISQVQVCDNGSPSRCDSAVVMINISEKNIPPDIDFEGVSVDTIYLETDEDAPVNFCASVSDPNGDTVKISDIKPIQPNGQLSQTSAGQFCFLYTPVKNYFGSSIWKVTVCDNGQPSLCDTVIIFITVNSVNDAPVAVNDTVSVLRNHTVNGNVLDNDSDPENNPLKVNTSPEGGPMHGELILNSNGDFEYTPNSAFYGNDFFSYIVCDEGTPSQCSSANVFINVDNIPVVIYQGVSPNGDGLNDFLQIDGIELFANNWIRIYDRYNNLVFETQHYNNATNNWHGQSNRGISKKDLPEDTYFYVVNLGDGSELISGFLTLKRDR